MTYTVIKNIGISIAEYLFRSKTYAGYILNTDIDLRVGDVFLYEKGYARVTLTDRHYSQMQFIT